MFEDFCYLYLESRIYQLAAAFEKFGDWCRKIYTLSPLHDISLAGYGFSAAHYHSNTQYEIPRDVDIVKRIMDNVRGRISLLSKRIITSKSERLGHGNVPDDERTDLFINFVCYSH